MLQTQGNSRAQAHRAPVIILSVRGQKVHKVIATDNHRARPFDLDELVAKIHVALRRGGPTVKRLRSGKVSIDFAAQHALRGKREIRLTQRQFDILQYLARRQDRVVYRNELLREVWGYLNAPLGRRVVDQAIRRLRRKLESDPSHPSLIRTVHGDGDRLICGSD